jgi:hypothetical protein
MNVLKAFSLYNEKVGYCQSMNFVVGFIMMLAAGNELDTFWFFSSLLKSSSKVVEQINPVDAVKMDGLKGFYKK